MLKKEEISPTQSVEDFVESRFRGPKFVPEKIFATKQQKEQQQEGRGEALHKAYFNDLNYSLLLVPVQNLQTFCEARSGSFTKIGASELSASRLASPDATTADVYYGLRAAYRDLGFEPRLADLTAAYKAELYQNMVEANYPQSVRDVLIYAQRLDAFGKFGCAIDGRPSWAAAIEPVKYNPPSDPSSAANTPSLTMYIKASAF